MADTLEKVVEDIKESKKKMEKSISEMERDVIFAYKSYRDVVEYTSSYRLGDSRYGITISDSREKGFEIEFRQFMAPISRHYKKTLDKSGKTIQESLNCPEEMTKLPYYQELRSLYNDLSKKLGEISEKIAADAASIG